MTRFELNEQLKTFRPRNRGDDADFIGDNIKLVITLLDNIEMLSMWCPCRQHAIEEQK
jgi:hypothetical protein